MNQTINQDNLNASLRFLNKLGESNLEQLKATDPQQAAWLEQLGQLLSKEGFCKQLLACPDKQAALSLFAHHGFTTTGEEIELLTTQLRDIAQKLVDNDGTLSEEELDQIAGGMSKWAAIACAVGGSAVGGAGIGTLFCPGIGTAIGAVLGAIFGDIMIEI